MFVVTYTIDLDSLVEFELLKYIISVNIVDFVFFPWISAQIYSPNLVLNFLEFVAGSNILPRG